MEDILLQAQVLLIIKNRQKAIDLLEENLAHDEVLKLRIMLALEDVQYDIAESLVCNKLSIIQEKDLYWTRQWYEFLDYIYDMSKQPNKRINNLRIMVEKGDIGKYPRLKNLLIEDGFWKKEYPELLKSLSVKLNSEGYAYVLDVEQEWEKLYLLIEENLSLVEKYGEKVYKLYPEKTTKLFEAIIYEKLKTASERKAYRKVGKLIKDYVEFGTNVIAVGWIEKIKTRPENKRKTALQDEMNRALEYIKK